MPQNKPSETERQATGRLCRKGQHDLGEDTSLNWRQPKVL